MPKKVNRNKLDAEAVLAKITEPQDAVERMAVKGAEEILRAHRKLAEWREKNRDRVLAYASQKNAERKAAKEQRAV